MRRLGESFSDKGNPYIQTNLHTVDVRKAFDTVWIDGLLFKLFSEFGIRGRMWLVIRDLYTGIKAQVLYSGSLSRKFDVLQGTGQGRILAPFMYKVYINELLNELTQHSCALSLNSISLTSPSFADDITLLSIYRTFLSTFMNMCYEYSIKWRYDFNHLKSGIVTFGETKRVHSEAMKVRIWTLGSESVSELYSDLENPLFSTAYLKPSIYSFLSITSFRSTQWPCG